MHTFNVMQITLDVSEGVMPPRPRDKSLTPSSGTFPPDYSPTWRRQVRIMRSRGLPSFLGFFAEQLLTSL